MTRAPVSNPEFDQESRMNVATAAESRPWYREPLVWLVAAIPAITVFAGLTTVVIAGYGADPVVRDDFRKEGIAINRDPGRDHAAARLGVTARVSDADGTLRVQLVLPETEAPRALVAILSHATRAEYDRMLTLSRGADGAYSARLPTLDRGHWYLELSPPNRDWRLTGEFVDRAPALDLRPAGSAGP
jgi:hypothetical protein